ncbi:MAG: glycoside hydrolase family 127 protein [Clostridia bacterium]|nr:glycoside hydrolase family 127 protein [Clostridia bacterium]
MLNAGQFLQHASIRDPFWARIREVVRKEGIPYQWRALNDQIPDAEPSYCMRNFRIAAGQEQGAHAGYVFQDSDVAKWLEGAAYTLRWHPDAELEATVDGAIEQIVAAQQPDGYLDTYYIINGLDKRWTNLKDNHELYCAGHMIEAAVAYYHVTGKRVLLDAMIRYVDYIDSVLGPEEGKLHGYPGHPVIEMALMRLYDITKDPKHLKLAKYFVDQRGQAPLYFKEEDERNHNPFYWKDSYFQYQYYQAGKPVREQADAEGHSVRAMYLYSGMADVARETGDESLAEACRRLWDSTVRRRMYVTGAVGSSEYGEAFTFDYDLPNDTIYGETCAAIGLVFFARRMLSLEAKGEYADVMERALYNGVISGMQLDGRKFFYVNPLEVLPEASYKDHGKRHVKPERQKWFGCACCPPNIIRLVSSIEDYVYSVENDNIFVHLYVGGDLQTQVGGTPVKLNVETEYPWKDDIKLTVDVAQSASFALRLRIPGWCRAYTVKCNGEIVQTTAQEGYISLDGVWNAGDTVELSLDMPVMLVRANPRVYEDAGKVAVMRGPLVYCLEEADNSRNLHLVSLGDAQSADFEPQWKPDKLGGIVELHSPGVRETDAGWESALYSPDTPLQSEPVSLTWIPYYAWANRALGEMRVWVRR